MRDTELYRRLLGLEMPWTVIQVELSEELQRVDVWAGHGDGQTWPCPACGQQLPLYDHSEERIWRHLDSCQFKTFLHARPPRVRCDKHGVRQVKVPWADSWSRFTTLFERHAIDVLLETDIAGGTRILRIHWEAAWRILERAVARGLLRKGRRLCRWIGVDEKAVAKGQKYVTLVCDLQQGTIEHISDDRKQASLDRFFEGLSQQQLEAIEAIAMDMWEPYFDSAVKYVPGAREKIVFDRYHIMTYLTGAVDRVRRREYRELADEGDDSLKGSKFVWLYNRQNLPEKHRQRFRELKALNLKTGRAWALKEDLRELWEYKTRGWGERHWRQWFFWASHSRLQPVIDAAYTVKRHLSNVLTYFEHPITNAMSEGLNSTIQSIKQTAHGFSNREYLKTAVYFHCGGLDLHPNVHGDP